MDRVILYEVTLEEDSGAEVTIEEDQTAEVEVETPVRMLVNGDYNSLENKPKINGVELIGDVALDLNETYIYEQTSAASVWTITHSLRRYPSVTVVDSAGSVVVGDVLYTSKDQIILTFQGAFSGTAYLN